MVRLAQSRLLDPDHESYKPFSIMTPLDSPVHCCLFDGSIHCVIICWGHKFYKPPILTTDNKMNTQLYNATFSGTSNSFKTTPEMTSVEKMAKRAARFGNPQYPSNNFEATSDMKSAEKMAARATNFGTLKATPEMSDAQKMGIRAARFGIPVVTDKPNKNKTKRRGKRSQSSRKKKKKQQQQPPQLGKKEKKIPRKKQSSRKKSPPQKKQVPLAVSIDELEKRLMGISLISGQSVAAEKTAEEELLTMHDGFTEEG